MKSDLLGVIADVAPLSKIVGTKRFQLAEAEGKSSWLSVPRGEEEPETEEYGISSFVYRRSRPFHPKRLNDVLGGDLEDGGEVDGGIIIRIAAIGNSIGKIY